jgi:hypothetical protein
MTKEMTKTNLAMALKSPKGDLGVVVKVKYFKFEEDFVEDNVRCIPMIVRFKLDACGIKLKLTEWCKMSTEHRMCLADLPCESIVEVAAYREYLCQLIKSITNQNATDLKIDQNPPWAQLGEIPAILIEKVRELNLSLSLAQWKGLDSLQRFALLKLSAASHESKNFPKALKEFNLA